MSYLSAQDREAVAYNLDQIDENTSSMAWGASRRDKRMLANTNRMVAEIRALLHIHEPPDP